MATLMERLKRGPIMAAIAVGAMLVLLAVIVLPSVASLHASSHPGAETHPSSSAKASATAGGESSSGRVDSSTALPASANVTAEWFDSTALVQWKPVAGATAYRVTLIRLADLGIMLQKQVPATQLAFDAQGIWPGKRYQIAVQAVLANGSLGQPAISAPGQSQPISRATYNGFLDTMNLPAGQVDTNLWDLRLGQNSPPNQGGTFINNQIHGHIEAGDLNGDQTFTSMRARVPFDFSGGRTLTVHGEVDLKGDFHNWFGAVLSAQPIGGDQLIDQVDRPLGARAVPQLELFTDENGLHLFEALPADGYEIGTPYKGGYHTNNVRDEIVWRVSTSHVWVSVNGVTAFDANWPVALPFTSGYLTLIAEDYPGNGGGVVPATACDGVMKDCNIWHLDSWGFDAPHGVAQPGTHAYFPAACGPYPSREASVVSFDVCGRLDNAGGYGFQSANGQTAATTIAIPSDFAPASTHSALLACDINGLTSASRLALSVNGSAFQNIGYLMERTNSWQAYGIAVPVASLHAGVNTFTFRDNVANAGDTPQIANCALETRSASTPYSPPQLPPEPAPIGTWH